MDRDDKIGGRLITEQDMICRNCFWRGEKKLMPPIKCLQYFNGKPLKIIAQNFGVECDYFTPEFETEL